jgi:hypothetical protein
MFGSMIGEQHQKNQYQKHQFEEHRSIACIDAISNRSAPGDLLHLKLRDTDLKILCHDQ